MKKFEVYTGGAVWMAVSLLMAAAALEPVDVRGPTRDAQVAAAACATDCASARL